MSIKLIATDGTTIELGKVPAGYGYVDKVLVIRKEGVKTEIMLSDHDIDNLTYLLST